MNTLACLVTCVKNEGTIFPFWAAYHMKHFDPCDVYVLDDNSVDGTPDIARALGFNVTPLPRENAMCERGSKTATYISRFIRQLLKDGYRCALYEEADDFTVAVNGRPLRDFFVEFVASGKKFYTLKHVAIVQDIATEPALDRTKPWLVQRSHAINVPKFNNPAIWSVSPEWSRGFHYAFGEKPEPDGGLLSIDTHTIDFDMCNERHHKRIEVANTVVDHTVDDALKVQFAERLAGRLHQRVTRVIIPECIKLLIP